MTLEQMIESVRQDTQVNDANFIITKLNAGQSWIYNRVFPMNKEILKVTDEEFTMAAATHTYNLGANVSTGTLISLENLSVKFTTETLFVPVVFISGSDPLFLYWDQATVQAIRPVYCVSTIFSQLRFAPGLPTSTIIRADYLYAPRPLSLETRATCDLQLPFHEAIVSKAKSGCFVGIDDDRAVYFDQQALDNEIGAKNVLGIRNFSSPPRTRPSHRSAGRLPY